MQSRVPEHTELAWIFNTITPLGELERQTQFKDKAQRQESVCAGLLNYPVLQAADILLYKADTVPVGEDQVQHLELSREIARRWNARFARDEAFFPEPQALLTPTRRIMGLDGQAKMSKSLGNTVGLLEEARRDLGEAPPRGDGSGARSARRIPARPRSATSTTCTRRSARRRRSSMSRAVPHGGVGVHRLQEGAARGRWSASWSPIRERARALRAIPGACRRCWRQAPSGAAASRGRRWGT